jgi:glutathione synthase/RimK-type ligase-like ATP-grasp enzyme
MTKIYALTDYKDIFSSKWKAKPYRSGYDKKLLKKYFNKYGYEIEFIKFQNVEFTSKWKNRLVIYTSSEEVGLHYKSYIEDIILGLEKLGAFVLPRFDFLRANNNKVYMEIMRESLLCGWFDIEKSLIFGTLNELQNSIENNKIQFPCVIKPASGAMSKGVELANNSKELVRYAKKISRTNNFKFGMKEKLRTFKYNGYQQESKYQNKFIIQEFIPNLKNDWKVLVYGDHYYILNRGIKKNDFRASGSHCNYKAGSKSEFPIHQLDFVEKIYKQLDIPHLSLDFAFDGKKGYVIEFQAIHFGTSTLEFCEDYYIKKNGLWTVKKQEFDQEEEYVWGIVHYLKGKSI